MTGLAAAENSLREGDPVGALAQLQNEVRAKPADAKLRTFLFQLLAVLGQWERSLTQLNTAAQFDPAAAFTSISKADGWMARRSRILKS